MINRNCCSFNTFVLHRVAHAWYNNATLIDDEYYTVLLNDLEDVMNRYDFD